MDDKSFDKKSAMDWSNTIEATSSGKREKDFYPRINSWMDQFSLHKILDLGSGQGICATKINLNNREYIGVEPSSFLVDRAKKLYPSFKSQYIVGSAYELPFENEAFDGSFSIAVWHLLEDLYKASSELSRVLKKEGRFLLITANQQYEKEWTESYDEVETVGKKTLGLKMKEGSLELEDTLFLRTEKEIKDALENVGLQVTNSEPIRIWTLIEGMKK